MRGTLEVHRYLVERAVPHEFYRIDHPLRHIEEAAAVLGLDPSIVVAVELFEAPSARVLGITSATDCASSDAAAAAAGLKRLRAASKSRTSQYTGFLAEWLPPVGHERPSRVVVEESLLGADVVYAAGGDPGVMLVLRTPDLMRATAGVPAALAASASLAG